MNLTAIIAGAVLLFFVGACIIVGLTLVAVWSRKKKVPRVQESQPMFATLSTVRMRTQHEVETDEDLEVIGEAYREQRKSERAQLALERLAKITPSAKSSK